MKDPRVLFMNTDGVLDLIRISIAKIEASVEVADGAFAVASQCQRVGHKSGAIFSEIESVLASVGKFGTSVWNNHLGNGKTPEKRTNIPVVVVRNVIQDDPFPIIEADVKLGLV
jgi:hypothetical protein